MSIVNDVSYAFYYLNKVCGFRSQPAIATCGEKEITAESFRTFLYGNGKVKPSLPTYDLLLVAKGIKQLGRDDHSEDFIEIAGQIDAYVASMYKNNFNFDRELNSKEIKSFLINLGILPSAHEAKRIYWGLKDNWWKQIIDGCPQGCQELVFDPGIYNRSPELGYLNGIQHASRVFINNLHQDLSFTLYQKIHDLACRHLVQESNEDPLPKEEKSDSFRQFEKKYVFQYFNSESYGIQKKH